VRFALITDVHFGPPAYFGGKLRKLSHRAGTLTRAFVEHMNDVAHPDLVVNLGDVIEDADRERDREQYASFVSLLDALRAPVMHVAGNHDTVNLDEDELRALWKHSGPLYYARNVGGVQFLVLHTLETKDVGIHLPGEQLEWIEAELAKSSAPVVVLMHHPAAEVDFTGNRWFEKAPHIGRVAERRKLRRIFEASGKVAVVFNGHAHWNHFDVIEGIPYVTLQSLTENLDDDAPGRAARAWAVCDIDPARVSIHVQGEEPARYQIELGTRR
jgi:3',5'-cyclic AMP phosphodiesterase CpdA